LWIQRGADQEVMAEISMTIGTEQEQFVPLTLDSTAPLGEDVDIAVMEICSSSIDSIHNHRFLDEVYLEPDLDDFKKRTNIVFVHGFPGTGTMINDKKKEVDMTTFPYLTFVKDREVSDESLTLFTEETGISEHGDMVDIPAFTGMSGSFVYGYNRGVLPYTFLGLLTIWDTVEKALIITTTSEVVGYIEKNFFN